MYGLADAENSPLNSKAFLFCYFASVRFYTTQKLTIIKEVGQYSGRLEKRLLKSNGQVVASVCIT